MSAPVGPYSPAVRVGDWVATSGQLGVVSGPSGAPTLVEGGTGPQLRQALANVAAVLATEGLGLADVVKATVFLADMADFPLLNRIWVELVPAPRPARSAVQVAALPLGARVEIEAWAHALRGGG